MKTDHRKCRNSSILDPVLRCFRFFFSQKKLWGEILTQIKTYGMVIIWNTWWEKKDARFLFKWEIRPFLTRTSQFALFWKKSFYFFINHFYRKFDFFGNLRKKVIFGFFFEINKQLIQEYINTFYQSFFVVFNEKSRKSKFDWLIITFATKIGLIFKKKNSVQTCSLVSCKKSDLSFPFFNFPKNNKGLYRKCLFSSQFFESISERLILLLFFLLLHSSKKITTVKVKFWKIFESFSLSCRYLKEVMFSLVTKNIKHWLVENQSNWAKKK